MRRHKARKCRDRAALDPGVNIDIVDLDNNAVNTNIAGQPDREGESLSRTLKN